MHRELVENERWISERRFLHALNYCMLLPGPEAQQLATYLGWLMHGYRGGLVAGGLFVLPGFVSLLALSLLHPATSQGAADLAQVPGRIGLDWFYLPLFPLLDRLPGPRQKTGGPSS